VERAMERRNGRKAEEGRMRIKLPYMKWPLRMLLYFLTLFQVMKRKELYAFRNSGILFIVLTLALFISIIQMVFYGQVKNYPGTMIFAVAAYTFYKIGIAIFHLFKASYLYYIIQGLVRGYYIDSKGNDVTKSFGNTPRALFLCGKIELTFLKQNSDKTAILVLHN
jgi:hypothetical protein